MRTPRSSSRTGECDPKRVDEDVEKLIAFYRGFGFFHATIGREVKFDEKQNCATLTFVVNEGPRYTIRNITFVGNRKLENARLAKQLKMLSGQYFDGNQQSLDLQKLRDEYGAAGYVLAKIKAESRFLEEPGKLDIVYHIEEGGRYRISRLNIETKGDNPAVYVIVASKDKGDHVAKVLANPSSTVASAILQVEGAAASAAKETVWLAQSKAKQRYECQQDGGQADRLGGDCPARVGRSQSSLAARRPHLHRPAAAGRRRRQRRR